ncbi:MAG: hypothetical protein CL566_04635 [Alphaproteobacteria bacterium]|nr:hypothetical protein [Alphaproteobacteria bacterium]|tara:strand:- start:590 stop:1219 length:630 start_codon:yes stop_codon:yes gene_type:complete
MAPLDAIWTSEDATLVLASGSSVRTRLLTAAGVPHQVEPANIDEGEVRDRLLAEDASHDVIAEVLAELKAQKVSERHPDAIVLGADQILSCNGDLFEKPAGLEGVRAHLNALSGKSHTLHTSVCAISAGDVIWHHNSGPKLRMRTFSDGFIDRYVEAAGLAVCETVGGYQMEGLGVHLFEEIEGDFYDILGLPMLPLLAFLRQQSMVLA